MTGRTVERVIEAGDPCFDGHFPGRPIVPGVVLLDAVQAAIGRPLRGIAAVKFVAPLGPGERFSIRWSVAGARADFRCDAGDRLLAQGSLLLAE